MPANCIDIRQYCSSFNPADRPHNIEASAILEIPGARHLTLERRSKEHNHRPDIDDAFDHMSDEVVSDGWSETPDKHGQREFGQSQVDDVKKSRRVQVLRPPRCRLRFGKRNTSGRSTYLHHIIKLIVGDFFERFSIAGSDSNIDHNTLSNAEGL